MVVTTVSCDVYYDICYKTKWKYVISILYSMYRRISEENSAGEHFNKLTGGRIPSIHIFTFRLSDIKEK